MSDSATLLIRPFKPDDAPGVVAVILPIQQIEFGIPVTLEEQPDLVDVAAFYLKGKGNFWVAQAQGRIVGTIGLLDIGGGQAALRKMFVAEAFRGATQGVAQRLLDVLLAWSARSGITEVFLGTTARFLAAHRFYEKNRFVEIPQSDLPARFPVMSVDSRFYRRVIAAALSDWRQGNLNADADAPACGERFDTLLAHRNLVVERIVSSADAASTEYAQPQDEWVALLSGEATIEIAGAIVELRAGDYLFIPANTPHTVRRVSNGATWLAIHLHP